MTAYAVYFDYRRRANAHFRRDLRRNERRQHRAEKDEAEQETVRQRQAVKQAVTDAKEEGFPSDVEAREAYFLQQVSEGETLAADREFPSTSRRTDKPNYGAPRCLWSTSS